MRNDAADETSIERSPNAYPDITETIASEGFQPLPTLWEFDGSDRATHRYRDDHERMVTREGRLELDGVSADSWFEGLGIDGVPSDIQKSVAELFCTAIESEGGTATIRSGRYSVPPHTMMVLWRTVIFIRVKAVTQLRTAVFAALVANQLMHNPQVAVGASIVAALWDNIRRLSERELEVIRTMTHLAGGRPYKHWIEQEHLERAMPPAVDGEVDKLDTLISMESRGLLEESAGRWRLIF